MNRLAPLIARRTGPWASFAVESRLQPEGRTPGWVADAKLFATAWLGGLVFFSTLLS